jgi:hypothetical protein
VGIIGIEGDFICSRFDFLLLVTFTYEFIVMPVCGKREFYSVPSSRYPFGYSFRGIDLSGEPEQTDHIRITTINPIGRFEVELCCDGIMSSYIVKGSIRMFLLLLKACAIHQSHIMEVISNISYPSQCSTAMQYLLKIMHAKMLHALDRQDRDILTFYSFSSFSAPLNPPNGLHHPREFPPPNHHHHSSCQYP